ncbi:MAG: 2-C-methyl-D-erythritol 4-phosphate cytidylyltransferase [Actinomycetota bacterium]|nr:2-C-methyl-D-erythritol 4-phosphate cytidylyltransferase [Actinomycetota bacterium]
MHPKEDDVAVVLMAAGSSSRYGRDKCLEELNGSTKVLDYSYEVARSVSQSVVVAASGKTFDYCLVKGYQCVRGGSTRSESVLNALEGLDGFSVVLVHDASRPLASATLFQKVIDKVRSGDDIVIPVVPVVDSLKVKTDSGFASIDRSDKYIVQTPQGLSDQVRRRLLDAKLQSTDESGAAEMLGYSVSTVEGERANVKVTYPDDIFLVRALLLAMDREVI